MTKVYVVTQREWPANEVEVSGVYRTRERAEDAKKMVYCGSIEEFDLDKFPYLWPDGVNSEEVHKDGPG